MIGMDAEKTLYGVLCSNKQKILPKGRDSLVRTLNSVISRVRCIRKTEEPSLNSGKGGKEELVCSSRNLVPRRIRPIR